MVQIIYTVITLLVITFVAKIKCEVSQNALRPHQNSVPELQDRDSANNILDYDLTEAAEKRAWNNLQLSGWGKRSWKDLNGGWGKRGWKDLSDGWGKRGWDNLHGSGWGKRGWQDLQTSGWGKRGKNLQSSGGKRSWKNLPSSGWGKRSYNELNNFWTKPDENDNADNVHDNSYIENLEDSLNVAKRAWNYLRGAWGKRSASDWASMKGAWGKRDPAWHSLKGLWGKRSLDNYSDISNQDTQESINAQMNNSSEE